VVSEPIVAPGAEAKIEVTVHTAGRHGVLAKTVTVSSDDPVNPAFKLNISGTVEVAVGFDPERLSMGDVMTGDTIVQQVKLVGSKAKEVKVVEMVSSDPNLISGKMVKGAKEPTLEVTIKPGDVARRFGGLLTVKTNLESPKEVQLRVDGRATSDISVDQDRVHFFFDENGKSTRDVVVFVSTIKGTKFKVTGIEDPQNMVQAKIDKVGDRYQVTMTMAEGKQVANSTLWILTDQKGDAEKLEVIYSARVQVQRPPNANTMPASNLPQIQRPRTIPTAIKGEIPQHPKVEALQPHAEKK